MARHSKNATSAPFYSYHERKKIKGFEFLSSPLRSGFAALGVGTLKERLDTRACRRFESCWLCLRTARQPVTTPQGVLYCKECLLLNMETQKSRLDKERQKWEALQAAKQRQEAQEKEMETHATQIRFLETAEDITCDVSAALKTKSRAPQTPEEMRKALEKPVPQSKEEARKKNFWVPENTPTTHEADSEKPPQKHICCPITGAPLKLKHIVNIKPSLERDADSETSRKGSFPFYGGALWLCALSGREIRHQKAAVVKATGQVVLLEYLEKFVFGNKGALTTGLVINKEDVIELRQGGTGFSAHNEVEVKIERPNVQ